MPTIRISASAVTTDSASSQTPTSIPNNTLKLPETGFLRQARVLTFVPFSKSTLWRRVKARTFPEPLKLSKGVTAWRAEDIRDWIVKQGQAG